MARCAVGRLMHYMGLRGTRRGPGIQGHHGLGVGAVAGGSRRTGLQRCGAESVVGVGPDVCGDLIGVRLRGVRDRRLRTAHRRVAGIPITAHPPRIGCLGPSDLGPPRRPTTEPGASLCCPGSSTCRSVTRNALPKPASNPASAASATPMTTASSSTPPWSGSIGSTPSGSSDRSETSHQPNTKPTTTVKRAQPRRPDSRQQVSDRPGGLHRIAVDRLPMRPTHGHQTGAGSNGQTDHFQGIPNRSRSPRESRPLPPTTSLSISQTNRRTRSSQSSLRGQMTGLARSSQLPR